MGVGFGKPKTPATPIPDFILNKPEYLSNSLQQLFHHREKAIALYVKARKAVAKVEMEISLAASPWRLGQIVNWNDLNGKLRRAIIARIQFTPSEPFYIPWIKLILDPKKTFRTSKTENFGRIQRVDNIAHIIGAVNLRKQTDSAELAELIRHGVVVLENFVDPEDSEFSKNIFDACARGDSLTKLSPSAEFWIRESLRLGKKPVDV